MVKPAYYMQCGCILDESELIIHESFRSCPEHKQKIDKIKIYCHRCGDMLFVSQFSGRRTRCDNCQQVLDQARTVHTSHNIPVFTDPFLSRKSTAQVLKDICVNVAAGYEVIQIDPIRETQREQKKIAIDFRKKLETLKKLEQEIKNQKSQLFKEAA